MLCFYVLDSDWRLYGSFDEITREWSDGVAAEEFSDSHGWQMANVCPDFLSDGNG